MNHIDLQKVNSKAPEPKPQQPQPQPQTTVSPPNNLKQSRLPSAGVVRPKSSTRTRPTSALLAAEQPDSARSTASEVKSARSRPSSSTSLSSARSRPQTSKSAINHAGNRDHSSQIEAAEAELENEGFGRPESRMVRKGEQEASISGPSRPQTTQSVQWRPSTQQSVFRPATQQSVGRPGTQPSIANRPITSQSQAASLREDKGKFQNNFEEIESHESPAYEDEDEANYEEEEYDFRPPTRGSYAHQPTQENNNGSRPSSARYVPTPRPNSSKKTPREDEFESKRTKATPRDELEDY